MNLLDRQEGGRHGNRFTFHPEKNQLRCPRLTASDSPGRPGTGSRGRGFTLVEAIIVVALVGILAMIGIGEMNKFSRREKLTATSNQFAVLLQQAALVARQQSSVVFVRIGPVYTLPTDHGDVPLRDIQLVVDTFGAGASAPCTVNGVSRLCSGDGSFQDPSLGANGDTVIQNPTLSVDLSQISFSMTDSGGSSPMDALLMTWPAGSVADTWVIGVNFRGQVIDRFGGALSGPAVLPLTHVDMVSGALTPFLNFELIVNPIWDVSVRRLVRNDAPGATIPWVTY